MSALLMGEPGVDPGFSEGGGGLMVMHGRTITAGGG